MDVHVAPLPKLQDVMGAHVLLVSPVSSHFYSPHLLSVTACQGWWQSVLPSVICLNQSFPAVLWVDPVGSGAHSNSVVTLLLSSQRPQCYTGSDPSETHNTRHQWSLPVLFKRAGSHTHLVETHSPWVKYSTWLDQAYCHTPHPSQPQYEAQ